MESQPHRQPLFTEDGQVDFPAEIAFDRRIPECKDDDVVSDKQRYDTDRDLFVTAQPQGDQRAQGIGDTDALQYAETAYLESFEVVERIHLEQFAHQEDQDASFYDLYRGAFGEFLVEAPHGKPDGGTDDEQKGREYQVGG